MQEAQTNNLHATAVFLDGRGILIIGPSGAGKSDLAIRLIDAGAELVADDQVLARQVGGRMIVQAPESIAGKLEVRGFGIVDVAHRQEAVIDLVIDLKPGRDIERMPDPAVRMIAGVGIPAVELDGFEASAVAKVKLILRGL